jgi:uncharacterized protein YecE (DUF72 family)
MPPSLYIGTSGWSYANWRTHFYAGIRQTDWLRYCAERFSALEVNATFYRHLAPSTYERWHEETPTAFRFAIKAHRFLTHQARLLVKAEDIARERQYTAPLGDKLTAVLWQMPAGLACDIARFAAFIELLSAWSQPRHAFEFRHPSWFNDEVVDLLARHRLAVCQSDAHDWPMWPEVTTDLVYVRLHGHTRTYCSNYSEAELQGWAVQTRRWLDEGRTVHVYFDNTDEEHAPDNALRLMELLA